MMSRRAAALFLTGFFAFAANSVLAQTLYKLIDRNGKVTYSGEAPKDFDGKVIRIDVDPNRNSATLGVPRPDGKSAEPGHAGPRREGAGPGGKSAAQRIEEARERLEAARKALADARDNPGEGDVRFIGNVGGGTRPVATDAYQHRLSALERAVKEAENELEILESGK